MFIGTNISKSTNMFESSGCECYSTTYVYYFTKTINNLYFTFIFYHSKRNAEWRFFLKNSLKDYKPQVRVIIFNGILTLRFEDYNPTLCNKLSNIDCCSCNIDCCCCNIVSCSCIFCSNVKIRFFAFCNSAVNKPTKPS